MANPAKCQSYLSYPQRILDSIRKIFGCWDCNVNTKCNLNTLARLWLCKIVAKGKITTPKIIFNLDNNLLWQKTNLIQFAVLYADVEIWALLC